MIRADIPAPWMRDRGTRWNVGEHELLETPDIGDLVAAAERGVVYGRSLTSTPSCFDAPLLALARTVDRRAA